MTNQEKALESLAHDLADIRTIQVVNKNLIKKIDARLKKYIEQLDKYTTEYKPKEDVHKTDHGTFM